MKKIIMTLVLLAFAAPSSIFASVGTISLASSRGAEISKAQTESIEHFWSGLMTRKNKQGVTEAKKEKSRAKLIAEDPQRIVED